MNMFASETYHKLFFNNKQWKRDFRAHLVHNLRRHPLSLLISNKRSFDIRHVLFRSDYKFVTVLELSGKKRFRD